MRLTPLRVTGGLLVTVLFVLWVLYALQRLDLEYAVRVTGLPLASATDVRRDDDLDSSSRLYCRLGTIEAEQLAARLPSVPSPDPWPGRGFLRGDDIRRFPAPSSTAALRGVHGCGPHNAWIGYFDPATHELWLEIMYPDMSGDDPGCNRAPWEPAPWEYGGAPSR